MRSSTFSTKSFSKYEVRDSVVCPISKMQITCNKRSRQFIEELVVCDGQVQEISFITCENGQLVASQQALTFLSKTSKGQEIQFMGVLGSSRVSHHFIAECLKQCKHRLATGIQLSIKQDFQYKNQRIFIYNFAIRKMNKLLYFIGMHYSEEQNGNMLQLLSFLSSGLTICVSQQDRKGDLVQRLICLLKGINDPPSMCHLICSNKIAIYQDLLQNLESVFDELTLTSFDAQNGCDRSKQKAKLFMQSISSTETRKEQSQFFKAKFIRHLIHNSDSINAKGADITLFVKSVYDQLLAEANSQYEEYFNQLSLQLLQDQDTLLEELQSQQDKILCQFNADMLDSQLHQLYLQKLLALIEEHQAEIIARIEQSTYEKVQYSMENTGEPQEAEIDNQNELLLAIEELKGNSASSHSTIEKVFILARNAARINVLGCDEKARVAQLRTAIDQKWEQLDEVRMEDTKRKEEASEENLMRQKYEMMQSKSSNFQTKIALLSQEILHRKSLAAIQCNTAERYRQLQQLQRIHVKNQQMLQFVANTSLQQPVIASIENKVNAISQSIKQLALKRQLILQAVHEHYSTP